MKGKSVIVTGAGSGLGREISRIIAQQGGLVTAADINEAGGNETVDMITKAGGKATFVKTNIAVEAECEQLTKVALDMFGRLDGAVNNAAAGQNAARLHETDLKHWNHIMDVNLTGTFLCMKYQIPPMLEAGRGSIVNIASYAGLFGFESATEYCASKAGVMGLTRAAAVEYGHHNIRVNAVCPGLMFTGMQAEVLREKADVLNEIVGMTALGRPSRTEEVAESAVWLLSDSSSYITGVSLPADGGMAGSGVSRVTRDWA
ncbi:NAD(P)-dependent dehydrogenase, short-chain alcohol dehydrogenase family [Sphingobium faniae]|nr:NAD(P)-dependent dehydrogenase, short-chain alcohol dehydrogenase family [Sphingobium faniae]